MNSSIFLIKQNSTNLQTIFEKAGFKNTSNIKSNKIILPAELYIAAVAIT